METKTIFTAFFFITTLVSSAYPNLGQEDTDDEPLVNPGREFDTLDAISPASQDYNNYMLENLPSKYITYLETCGKNMGPSGTVKCNVDVLKEILTNKPISRECCQKVILDEMITILTPSYERDKTSNKEDKEEESRISYCASSLPEGIKHIDGCSTPLKNSDYVQVRRKCRLCDSMDSEIAEHKICKCSFWDRCSAEVESPSSSHHDEIGLS
ncbi:hypothetical protein F2Q69_00038655 [Brassica cretica]|uniref:Prolamin-like domain-containing protein n=1 Tax=Brassica cretica TaxID=69181 RepID=A0A8S9SE48_BRACR|nr:hypothetical protein F2Q69_00038655 [Brassica cretica]